MSILRKKPFIESLIANLSVAELNRLAAVMDDSATAPAVASLPVGIGTLPASAPADVNDKIRLVLLALSGTEKCVGILVYHSASYCVLIGTVMRENGSIPLYKLDISNRTYKPIEEYLTVEELRRAVDDGEEAAPGGKDAWVEAMKQKVGQDAETNTTEIGNNAYIDGKLEVDDEASFNDHFSVYADNGSRMIDANTANKVTSLYGKVNIGSSETTTNLDVHGKITTSGTNFIQTNQIKTNAIHCLDAGEVTPVVSVVSADLAIDTSRDIVINGVSSIKRYTTGENKESLFWHGTQAQYDALATKNADTIYLIHA